MNRFIKTSLWLLLAGAVLSALLIATMMQWAAPFDGATLSINGEQFTLAQLQGSEWLLAIGAVLLAMVVVLLVVPFAVIVPLLCAALGIAVALCVLLSVAALLLSPLWLLAWIAWRLTRSPSATREPGATMSA
jgi:hypothetical protein